MPTTRLPLNRLHITVSQIGYLKWINSARVVAITYNDRMPYKPYRSGAGKEQRIPSKQEAYAFIHDHGGEKLDLQSRDLLWRRLSWGHAFFSWRSGDSVNSQFTEYYPNIYYNTQDLTLTQGGSRDYEWYPSIVGQLASGAPHGGNLLNDRKICVRYTVVAVSSMSDMRKFLAQLEGTWAQP